MYAVATLLLQKLAENKRSAWLQRSNALQRPPTLSNALQRSPTLSNSYPCTEEPEYLFLFLRLACWCNDLALSCVLPGVHAVLER